MNSPGFHRVTLIPMETVLYDSENSHTEKQPEKFEDIHFMINSSVHEFLTILWGVPITHVCL